MVNWPYAAIMVAAIAAGATASRLNQRPLQITGAQKWALALGAFTGSMIGAKLPYLFTDIPKLISGEAFLDNGKTITFGLVGGYFGVEFAKKLSGIHHKTGDTFAMPVALAIAIGRLACFHAGCCYGTPTNLPWAVRFADGLRRHPTQIYEFLFHLGAAGVLLWLQRRGAFHGQLIKLYFIAYFLYRFITEFIRPEPRLLAGLTLYQWAAIAFIPLFIWLWRRDVAVSAAGRHDIVPAR